MLGRFHVVRVIFGATIIILSLVIFKQQFHKLQQQKASLSAIELPADRLRETWMTPEEFESLSLADKKCPVCFGREACEEITQGMSKGTLGISRNPLSEALNPEGPPIHPVHKLKNGKVKYWLRLMTSHSEELVTSFEDFVCRNASLDKKKVGKCDVSVAASSTFLYSSTLDLTSIRGLYRAHLVSPRRLPMTLCPTYKLIRGLVESFDEDDDQTLTGDEKAVLISSLATNPDVVLHRFILQQKLQFPVLPYFGSCGRVTFIQGPHRPLYKYVHETLAIRLELANQLLQLVDAFIHDDPAWLLFTSDIAFESLIVTQDENQVFLKDLSNVILIDRDLADSEPDDKSEITQSIRSGTCADECFKTFYEKLTSRKNEKDEREENMSSSFESCGQLMDLSAHMYGFLCRNILSDLPAHVAKRPVHKRGLLNSLEDGKDLGLKFGKEDVERLLKRCADDPVLSKRKEAALELVELLNGSLEDEEAHENDNEIEDFNDNNIKFNENEDFHAKYEQGKDAVQHFADDDDDNDILPKKLIQAVP